MEYRLSSFHLEPVYEVRSPLTLLLGMGVLNDWSTAHTHGVLKKVKLEIHISVANIPVGPTSLMLSSPPPSSGLLETQNRNPENAHREQNNLLRCFLCGHTALVRIYPTAFRTDDRIIAFFFFNPLHDTNQEKKIIIKFYKLAATENKQESTIRNESEALTESPLRTITLM